MKDTPAIEKNAIDAAEQQKGLKICVTCNNYKLQHVMGEKMGVVRVDDKLIKEVQEWLNKNGNKYKHPTISAFVNNAVYEKLKELGNKTNDKKRP